MGVSSRQIIEILKDKGVPFHCFVDGAHHVWTCEDPQHPGVAWTVLDDHAWFYRHGRALENWRPGAQSATALKAEHETETPPLSLWQEWAFEASPGHFFCTELSPDLRAVRRQLLESGRSPRVSLKSLCSWAALRYRCTVPVDGVSGWCVVRELPQHWEIMQKWAEGFGVEYKGQGLPGLTQEVFLHLLRGKRKTPTFSQKKQILAAQGGKCLLCGEEGAMEFDHHPPLRQLLAGEEQKFRALCKACHQEVTQAQGGAIRLESRFSPRAWREFVQSPRPPPLVFQPERPGEDLEVACEIDVIRCRRSALTHPACAEFPVFSSLDNIVPFHSSQPPYRLADFSFVTRVRDRRKSALALLPWVGPSWYARPSVEFMLHHGICTWGDISHSFQASGRVDGKVFRPVLDQMEQGWCAEGLGLGLQKKSVNCMIGLWAIGNAETLSVVSGGPADGEGSWASLDFHYGDKTIKDWVHRVCLVDNSSWRPIHDFVMSSEHVAVATARLVVARLKIPFATLDVKTDALILGGVAAKHLERLREAVEGVRYCDLHTLAREGGQKTLLDQHGLFPREGTEPVFRFRTEGTRLKGRFRTPRRVACPPGGVISQTTALSQEEAREHLLQGHSLMVEGLPGVGKSYWVAGLCKELEDQDKRLCVIAKTHASVANFNSHLIANGAKTRAITADHWANAFVRRGRCPFHCVIVEECSQIDAGLWDEIAKASLIVPQWIVCGDFAQFQAICDTFCGRPAPSPQGSDLLRELTGGHSLVMCENKRSDPELFSFVQAVLSSTHDLPEILAQARLQFPLSLRPARYNLCLSHSTRVRINRLANDREKQGHPEAIHLRASASSCGDNVPQSFWTWAGQELIGAGGRAKKGIFYVVQSATEDRIVVEGNGQTLALTHEAAAKSLRLTHALTYASCQGLSLAGVRLTDTYSQHFTWRHLYVGASRCTSARLLEVV